MDSVFDVRDDSNQGGKKHNDQNALRVTLGIIKDFTFKWTTELRDYQLRIRQNHVHQHARKRIEVPSKLQIIK